MSKPKLYIAGPMTGIPQFNYPAFEAAAKFLRYLGHSVISPAEEDSPETQRLALASKDGKSGMSGADSWGVCLGKDVQIIADEVDGICFLPNWQRSRGAKVEALTGLLTNKLFFEYDEHLGPVEVHRDHVREQLKEAI